MNLIKIIHLKQVLLFCTYGQTLMLMLIKNSFTNGKMLPELSLRLPLKVLALPCVGSDISHSFTFGH